jgi:RNA-directed DNA polymerase
MTADAQRVSPTRSERQTYRRACLRRKWTGRGRAGQDIRDVIADLNPILRGWGNYFRTGNATIKFQQIDRSVERRLHGLMRKRYGRYLRRGQWKTWTRKWFEAHGLYRLRCTIRYPGSAS